VGQLWQDMDYWDAVQRYEEARNRLASERVEALMGSFSACIDRDDEVEAMHRAWLKLRNFLASKHNTSFLKWCPAEAKEHPPNFSQFIEHCRRVKRQKATKKMIDTYCDKPSFLGGPEK
jgi:ferritin